MGTPPLPQAAVPMTGYPFREGIYPDIKPKLLLVQIDPVTSCYLA